MLRTVCALASGILLALALAVAVPGTAGAAEAVYGHRCFTAGPGTVCASENRDGRTLVGVGSVRNASGRICITGIQMWKVENGQRVPIPSTHVDFGYTRCAPTSGGADYVQVRSNPIQPCQRGSVTYFTHVTYVLSGKATTVESGTYDMYGSGLCD